MLYHNIGEILKQSSRERYLEEKELIDRANAVARGVNVETIENDEEEVNGIMEDLKEKKIDKNLGEIKEPITKFEMTQ